MLKRSRRWSGNREKRWILEGNYRGITSFWKYRNKSALYFWRTYKEMVGKTEGTRTRTCSPLASTPILYSITAGILAAFITLLLTIAASRYYGQYSYHRLEFIVADLLFASVLVASIASIIATRFAIRSYRRGWIFSVRLRRPARREWSPSRESLRNVVLFSATAFVVTSILVFISVIGGYSSQLTYGTKEVLVTVIAFLASCIASYVSIHAVRNGEITRTTA